MNNKIGDFDLIKFYFNYSVIDKFLKCYLSDNSDIANSMSKILSFSGFNINLNNNELNLEGYTGFYDSIPSYINAFSKIDPGKISAYNILSDKTAIYTSVSFKSFDESYSAINKQFKYSDSSGYENINHNINKNNFEL